MNNINIQFELTKLLESKEFDSQEEILKELNKKGIEVTQATLSRNLKKIGAIKQSGAYKIGPVGYALDGFSKVISMKYVEPNIIIIKTTPGLAQSAAALLDSAHIDGVEGTVAGDDTIITIINSSKKHSTILKNISNLFNRARK